MKRILFFIGLLFMVSIGCEKDEVFTELTDEATAEIKGTTAKSKKIKMVPLKGKIIEIADPNAEPIDCLGNPFPSRFLDIGGHVTHLGNVAGGFVEFSNCRLDFIDDVPFLFADAIAQFRAANGDIMTYEGEFWLSPVDPSQNGGAFDITGGTGRWENATGHFSGSVQPLEDGTTLYTVSGMVTPPGKNK
jgi:hypothetical protein